MSKNKHRFSTSKPTSLAKSVFATSEAGYNNRNPEFSFKYYDSQHKEYSCKSITRIEDFYEMFERLRRFSQTTWAKIKQAPQAHHFHGIEWSETAEPHGFNNPLLRAYPACQFKLFQECRVIGFFNSSNIFEIVWIDRHHKIYPRK